MPLTFPQTDYKPGYLNFDPNLLRKWRKALAQVRAGTGFAKLACYGDSTTRGTGAGTGGSLNVDGQANGYPRRLADMLNSYFIPARHSAVWGGGWGSGGSDARLSMGAGWAISGANGFNALGGATLSNNSTTNVLSFTPTGQFDTCVVWYGRQTSKGTFNLDIDGGSATSVATAGVTATLSQTKTASLGTHTVNITPTTIGQGIDIVGIDCYNSAAPDVRVWNCGRSGAIASDLALAGNAIQSLTVLQTVAPDLTVLNIGINDMVAATSQSSYQASINAIITGARVTGDIVLMVPTPIDPGNATQDLQNQFRAWLLDLAKSNSAPLIDMSARWINYSAANTDGLMGNGNHPSALGYADEAAAIANLIARP